MAGRRGQTQHEASFAVIYVERMADFIDGALPDGPALYTVKYLKPQRAMSMPGALYINK